MRFHYTDLEDCHTATGVVIIVDVLRAFSTAAYAFSRGAREIILVGTVEEALSLRAGLPDARVMGEVGGLRPQGFDFSNSPTHISEADLAGITMIHRTSAGTQGVVRSQNAGVMLAGSFVIAGATARYVSSIAATEVTFVITGRSYNGGDEDLACAEYIEQLLNGEQPDHAPFRRRVMESKDAFPHLDPAQRDFPLSDLDLCADIDRFDFALPIIRTDRRLLMRRVTP